MIEEFKKKLKFAWMPPPQTMPRGCMIYLESIFKEQQQPSGMPCWAIFQAPLAPASLSRRPRRPALR
eukprot:5969059-Ditylum_brightwellii.AAC.1